MKQRACSMLAALAAGLLAGCQSVTLQSTPFAEADSPSDAFAYSLPRGMVQIDASRMAGEAVKLTLPVQHIVPDSRARYKLSSIPAGWAHDKFVLETDAKGLLASVNGEHEDKSAEIAKEIVSIIADAAKLGFRVSKSEPGKPAVADAAPFDVRLLFDPFDAASRAAAGNVLEANGLELAVKTLEGDVLQPRSSSDTIEAAANCAKSICFRLLVPVIVRVSAQNSASYVYDQVLLLPDPVLVAGFDVTRAACIKKVTKLTFSEGILTKADIDKPSEVLGCISIPAQILKSAVGFPAALLAQRKTDIDAQKQLLDSQVALIKSQAALVAAQTEAFKTQGG